VKIEKVLHLARISRLHVGATNNFNFRCQYKSYQNNSFSTVFSMLFVKDDPNSKASFSILLEMIVCIFVIVNAETRT
jgi:hypothetical protein